MIFGPTPVSEAEGAILAHSVGLPNGRLRKGVILTPDHIADLLAAGIGTVSAARLEAGDCHEDAAAARIAAALVPKTDQAGIRVTRAATGRVNLIAEGPGVVTLEAEALMQANDIDPMITIATVPPFQQMAKGGMIATIKIISYAVRETDVVAAVACLDGAITLRAPVLRCASLIVTETPGGPGDKGVEAIANRIAALGMELTETRMVAHDTEPLARALGQMRGDLTLILTASATSDAMDVAPQALREAGGTLTRFGMPVDPGNLLFLGALKDRPVIGLPGCARSPALNGADWILSRVACGIDVTGRDIAALGIGGLLKDIPTRPLPRARASKD